MRNSVFFTILLYLAFIKINAQVNESQFQFESLQMITSPAYVILGVDPENIQRPNSPKDFVANVQSAIVDGVLQPNFALETTPYYWQNKEKNSKAFNAYDYVTSNNYWDNFAKSISFSLASSPSDTFTYGQIPKGTGFGVGLRMQLYQGNIPKETRTNLIELLYGMALSGIIDDIIIYLRNNKIIDDFDFYLDQKLNYEQAYSNLENNRKELIKNKLKSLSKNNILDTTALVSLKMRKDVYDKKNNTAATQLNNSKFPLTREGFMLEFAIANARIISHNSWDSINNAKTAIWITPSYRFNVNKNPKSIDFIDIMAVIRGTINTDKVDSSNYFDFGGKIQWIHNKLSISGELIYRYASKVPESISKNYTYKTGITFNYKINDFVTFMTTFGSNFDGNTKSYDNTQPMMIIGGFNFGISGFKSGS